MANYELFVGKANITALEKIFTQKHARTHTYIHRGDIHTYIHTYIHSHTHTRLRARTHVHTYIHTYTHTSLAWQRNVYS